MNICFESKHFPKNITDDIQFFLRFLKHFKTYCFEALFSFAFAVIFIYSNVV